jgi:multidrug efflux pump
MRLSEVSIQRPVLATVMTLVLILLGIVSFTRLSLRQYPDITSPLVSVRIVYPGASARLVETDVTAPLEEALSGIESVKTFTSTSSEEVSQVTLEFEQTRNLDAAANDVRDRVAGIRPYLPPGAMEPSVGKASADAQAILWFSLFSDRHTDLELTDYAERHLKDRFASLPGVAQVWVWGARQYAMRIWLDAGKLSSRQLTVQDVETALRKQNVAIPSGRIESERLEFPVRTRGDLQTPEQFNRVIVAWREGYPIRLEDVGSAEIGAEDDRKLVRLNGNLTISLGIVKQSKANTLAVAHAAKTLFQEIHRTIPEGMTLRSAGDSSLFIERSIREVYVAMGISLTLVVLVIFLFLGSLRATLIPSVAIPASIISAFTLMYAFGYSINILTLLGLVLAIGLVVDDAIVMLENIHRRIERGQQPLQAALDGSREVGFAVLATTVSLVAVFLPMFVLKGTTMRLFSELAVAVAGSVLISGFIALTLTPMMSARLLREKEFSISTSRVARTAKGWYSSLLDGYRSGLRRVLNARPATLAATAAAVAGAAALLVALPAELAPLEDSGSFMVAMTAPEGSTIRYTDHYVQQLEQLFPEVPEIKAYLTWVGTGWKPTRVNRAGTWVTLTDWKERSRSQQEIVDSLTPKLNQITGIRVYALHPPAFEQAGMKAPIQLILGAPSYEGLEQAVNAAIERMQSFSGFVNIQSDLELNKPELDVQIHRNKAADLGVSAEDIGHTLETMLGGRVVTNFIRNGKEHPVLVKIRDRERVKPTDIAALYVRGDDDELVQLSNLVSIDETVVPTDLNHYDKMRAATITAGLASGYVLGDALDFLETTVRDSLPSEVTIRFGGESKEFQEASGTLLLTFILAFVMIYLVLAAQFESFIHPLTILMSVPPAVAGALATLLLIGGSLNLYSEIGLIMLLGLVSKNAILIVDFANRLHRRGMEVFDAVVEASALRLRPILMTTLATILGALPLALASGAGSAGRRQLGWVIVGGMIFSTLLTLFVVPAIYTLLARRTGESPRAFGPPSFSEPASATQPELVS